MNIRTTIVEAEYHDHLQTLEICKKVMTTAVEGAGHVVAMIERLEKELNRLIEAGKKENQGGIPKLADILDLKPGARAVDLYNIDTPVSDRANKDGRISGALS